MHTDEPSFDPESERQIQAAVEKRMAEWHSQDATAMRAGMQASLASLDNVGDQLETERAVLLEELEQTRERREEINRRANQLLQEAIEQKIKNDEIEANEVAVRRRSTNCISLPGHPRLTYDFMTIYCS